MTNLARQHRNRKLAALQGAAAPELDARAANQYQLMQMQLGDHRRRLKQVQSIERKIDIKRQLLPEYSGYIQGVLQSDSGQQDDVLMTVMIWRIDIGDITGALDIAAYAIRHGLQTPDRYERSTACLIAEEVADTALKLMDTATPVPSELITRTIELTAEQDMFDQVQAKLLKAQGLALIQAGQQAEAMEPLKRALALDERCGVKKLIETTERELKKLGAAPDTSNQNSQQPDNAPDPEPDNEQAS